MYRLNKFVWLIVLFLSQNLSALTIKECDERIKQAVQLMNEGEHTKSLEILEKIKKLSIDNNWHQQNFLAINNIGVNFYMMLDYGEALDNYLEAYKIAIKYLDKKQEIIVLNNIAILYSKEQKYNKAEEYFTKVYEIAVKNKDNFKSGIYALNLATVYCQMKKVKQSESYITIARKHISNSDFEPLIQLTEIDNLISRKKYRLAEQQASSLLAQISSNKDDASKISLLQKMARIHLAENNPPLALVKTLEARKLCDNLEDKENIFQLFSDIYSKENNIRKALLYKDSVLIVHDSINQIKNGKLFENSLIKFELQNSKQELSDSEIRHKKERLVFISFVLLLVFLIVFFIWALRNRNLKNKQQKILDDREKTITILELEKEKNERLILETQLKEKETLTLLEEEKLRFEIESQNRKLATKALYTSTKKELIEDLIQALTQHIEHPNSEQLKSYIRQLKQHLRQDNDYQNTFSHFEETTPQTIKKLKEKHPDLNANDIRFLSYIYMNLSNKEISSLLNITLDATRKRKERISKKMNLSEETNLYTYITNS